MSQRGSIVFWGDKKNEEKNKITEEEESEVESEGVSATQSPILAPVPQSPPFPWPMSPKSIGVELVPETPPDASQMYDTGCTQIVNLPDHRFEDLLKARREQQEGRVGPLERQVKGKSLSAAFSRESPSSSTAGPSHEGRHKNAKRAREEEEEVEHLNRMEIESGRLLEDARVALRKEEIKEARTKLGHLVGFIDDMAHDLNRIKRMAISVFDSINDPDMD